MELVRKQTYITPAQDRAVKLLAQRQGTTEAEILRQKCRRWADDNASLFEYPKLPIELNDRAADLWEPLLAIAPHAHQLGKWLGFLALYDLVFVLLAVAVFDFLLED